MCVTSLVWSGFCQGHSGGWVHVPDQALGKAPTGHRPLASLVSNAAYVQLGPPQMSYRDLRTQGEAHKTRYSLPQGPRAWPPGLSAPLRCPVNPPDRKQRPSGAKTQISPLGHGEGDGLADRSHGARDGQGGHLHDRPADGRSGMIRAASAR